MIGQNNDNRREMLRWLLDSLEMLQEFPGPPEDVVDQFAAWIGQVSCALEVAGMRTELQAWNDALAAIRFGDDYRLPVTMSSLRAVILGILSRTDGDAYDELFPMEIVEEARSYIQKIALEANGCYEKGWYDACVVMIRRLIETLIIECFEKHKLEVQILNSQGDYFNLADLIKNFVSESKWHLSRNTKRSLPKLKSIGDWSAHNRRFLANRHDLDRLRDDIRVVVQELVYIAGHD